MEKQEVKELDLSRWIIVHETPLLGWLGRVSDEQWKLYSEAEPLEAYMMHHDYTVLHEALVLQTTHMPTPVRGGQVRMGIVTNVMPPHSLTTDSILITVKPRGVTLVSALSPADQHSLRRKIEQARASQLSQRSGLVAPRQA